MIQCHMSSNNFSTLGILFQIILLIIRQQFNSSILSVNAFSVQQESLSNLLQRHVTKIARFKEEAETIVGSESFKQIPYNNDVFYLRYCLEDKSIDDLKETLKWRQNEGKDICNAAISAFQQATAGDNNEENKNMKWNNQPVRDSAPYATKINKYITPSTTITTSSSRGDLIYCIRAGYIDDQALMSSLDSNVDNLVDFFLYCKEINAIVANDRSITQDQVLYVITVNDLNGLQLIGGDATFRKALSLASKRANILYPALAGPTLLLNLPRLLSTIVKLFTPLFPPEVNARLKFERGPLQNVHELLDISYGGKDRESFLKDIDNLCYDNK